MTTIVGDSTAQYGSMPTGGATIGIGNGNNNGNGNSITSSSLAIRAMYGLYVIAGFLLGIIVRALASNRKVEWLATYALKEGCGSVSGGFVGVKVGLNTSTFHPLVNIGVTNQAAADAWASCVADQIGYRISFSLVVFFLVHMIISSRVNLCMLPQQQVAFNTAHTVFRPLVFIALLVVSFFIPDNFYVVFAWFCLVLSVLFLIAQLMILLEFAYSMNARWVESEEQRYAIGLAVVTGALFVGSLVTVGFMYHWFGAGPCQTGQGFVSMTLVAAVLYTFLSIMSPSGSILPSGIVFAYTTWTCYSALSTGVAFGACNTIEQGNSTGQMVIAALITGVSLVYTATSAATSRDAFTLQSETDLIAADGGEEAHEASNFTFFHAMMLLASAYLAMLLSSWSITGASSSALATAGGGAAPMWAKFATELVCILMYTWTLAAPMVCSSREF